MRKIEHGPAETPNIEANSENAETDAGEVTSRRGWLEYIREHGREIGAATVGALALTGAGSYIAKHVHEVGALESTPAALAAVDGQAAQDSLEVCPDNDPTTVSVDYVNSAIVPLATEAINVYHQAKRSQKKKLKANELYGDSYRHLTEIDVAIPARWPGHKRKGTYNITAQFKGSVTPNNMVAIEVEQYPGHLAPHGPQKVLSPYDYILEKTTHDGPSNTVGLHWVLQYDHLSYNNCGVTDSLLANGDEIIKSSMKKSFFDAANQQAVGVVKRMEQHEPMVRQPKI